MDLRQFSGNEMQVDSIWWKGDLGDCDLSFSHSPSISRSLSGFLKQANKHQGRRHGFGLKRIVFLFFLMSPKSVSRTRVENLPDDEKHLQPVPSHYRIFGVFTLA